MDIADILCASEDQERGADLDLLHPATGEPTGMVLRIAGPDSDVQRRAKLKLQDDMKTLFPRATSRGIHVPAEDQERVAIDMLARCVLSWNLKENGVAVPCDHKTVVRVLKAAVWIREQVDTFAASRTPYFKKKSDQPAHAPKQEGA